MHHTSNCAVVATNGGSTPEVHLPLIDERLQAEWREDLSADDIRQILAQARLEAQKGLIVIKDAAEKSDLASLKRSAHKLKGMVGNLGAVRLVAVLREIELGADAGDGSLTLISQLDKIVQDSLHAFEAAA